jgi:hypothetical protein
MKQECIVYLLILFFFILVLFSNSNSTTRNDIAPSSGGGGFGGSSVPVCPNVDFLQQLVIPRRQEALGISTPDTPTIESQVDVLEDTTNRITAYEATYGPILLGTASVNRLINYINLKNAVQYARDNLVNHLFYNCPNYPGLGELFRRLNIIHVRLIQEFENPLAVPINQLNQRIQSGRL